MAKASAWLRQEAPPENPLEMRVISTRVSRILGDNPFNDYVFRTVSAFEEPRSSERSANLRASEATVNGPGARCDAFTPLPGGQTRPFMRVRAHAPTGSGSHTRCLPAIPAVDREEYPDAARAHHAFHRNVL
jgi:hypothetical protein